MAKSEKRKRITYTQRKTISGCFLCHGGAPHWTGWNAAACAASHHDHTGHPTWAELNISIRYGEGSTEFEIVLPGREVVEPVVDPEKGGTIG